MKSISLILLVGLFNLALQAQTLDNFRSSFNAENGKMTITYDLIYPDGNQKFTVTFFSSHDNYTQPLRQITGDVGENILPGIMKRAVWEARSALPADFDGDIQIKFQISKMAGPRLIVEQLALKTYKRGQTISLKWEGGNSSDKIAIGLNKNNATNRIVEEKIDNTGSYEWKMPNSVIGKTYNLILTNASQSNEEVSSSEFAVKPRVPLLLKILPIVAIGGAAVFLSGGSKEDSPGTITNDVLPKPIKP